MSKSPSLRRIQADIRELAIDPSDRYHAAPLENDMFEWHFTIRGADSTDFEGGIYHGRILLPAEYPFKPPNIMFLTPSGRFETNTKVCLSFSAFHPELWQPAWGIRLILEALISFLPTKGDGAIGALDWTSKERKRLAKESVNFVCPQCGSTAHIMKALDKQVERHALNKKKCSGTGNRFQSEIEQLHLLQSAAEEERKVKAVDEQPSNPPDSTANEKSKVEEISEEEEEEGEEEAMKTLNNVEKSEVVKKSESSDVDAAKKSADELIIPQSSQESTPPSSEEVSESTTTHTNSNDVVEEPAEERLLDSPWFSDPILNVGIVMFSILVFLLARKLHMIVVDISQLESQFSST